MKSFIPMPQSSSVWFGEIFKSFHNSNDVTDNRTKNFIRSGIIMNDKFHREDERLKTFTNWNLNWLSRKTLAKTGMFYTGREDKVKCYFCEVEIGKWEREDDPVSEHLRFSQNCPLLRRRTTNNVPINAEELNHLLPPVSHDVCGTLSSSDSDPSGFEYPEYAIEEVRKRTFIDWPSHMKQTPSQMAEAGFFYSGVADRVKCFCCGGGLKDWDDTDEPWEQHALWLPKCRYLNLVKGRNFIDSVIAKQTTMHVSQETENENTEKPNCCTPPSPQPLETSKTNNSEQIASSTASSFAEKPSSSTASSHLKYDTISLNSDRAQSTTNNIPEEKLCKICYANEYNTAFLPCGHVVACAKCALSVKNCPMCREPFKDVMRVYFS